MPEAGKEIIRHIDFPEYPKDDPGWVDIVCNPGREVFLSRTDSEGIDGDSVLISKVVRKWNFTLNSETLPITPENIAKCLSVVDRVIILKAIGVTQLLDDEKKNN